MTLQTSTKIQKYPPKRHSKQCTCSPLALAQTERGEKNREWKKIDDVILCWAKHRISFHRTQFALVRCLWKFSDLFCSREFRGIEEQKKRVFFCDFFNFFHGIKKKVLKFLVWRNLWGKVCWKCWKFLLKFQAFCDEKKKSKAIKKIM